MQARPEDSEISPQVSLDDLPFRLTAVLGDVELTGHELKALVNGSRLDLNQIERAPLLILANGQPVALADPIVDEENFGIRITMLLDEEQKQHYRKYGQLAPYTRVLPGD